MGVMREAPENPNGTQPAGRANRVRTFLKGVVYYDNRRFSVDCTVRDISDTGAQLVFATAISLPDNIELYIPLKQRTHAAQIRRRDGVEIGVSFQDNATPPKEEHLAQRVTKLEDEMIAIRKLLKRLKAGEADDHS